MYLPISTTSGNTTSLIDAFFTATSATCVTGLTVYTTYDHFTIFGQIVILILIQIGGLGFMTIITMFFIFMGKKITIKERMVIQESLNQTSMDGIISLVKKILIGTLIIEGTGAVLLTIRFLFDGYGFVKSVYMGVFHSVSAFCNAGFDIIGPSSLIPYKTDLVINVVIMLLIIIGGLGFTVWFDTIKVLKLRNKEENKNRRGFACTVRKMTLHSRVVLTVTAILIVFGAVLFFVFEHNNPKTLGDLSYPGKILASFMQSVTTRTAGFAAIDQAGMTYASKFLTIILMFIGGSPAGTAGGIKTSTIGVLIVAVISIIKGKQKLNLFDRSINFSTLQKALTIFFIYLFLIVSVTMVLTFTESSLGFEFIDIMFEAGSALGTVGLTTGVTPSLSWIGKILISFLMYMGRVGPVTIAVSLTKQIYKNKEAFELPEEKIIVG